jgi:hypothetical protein
VFSKSNVDEFENELENISFIFKLSLSNYSILSR